MSKETASEQSSTLPADSENVTGRTRPQQLLPVSAAGSGRRCCCSSPLIRRGECQETQISGSPLGRRSYGSRNRGLSNSPLGCCLRHCVPSPCSSPLSHRKRKTRTLLCSGFSWCSKAIQIRTISLGCNFCRFSKGDGLCSFFIVEGYQNLIIIQVNRIDEGVHQCLPLVFQAHIQLTEPQQPSQSNFSIVCNIVGLHIAKYAGQNSIRNLPFRLNRMNSSVTLGFASFSSAMRASSSRLVSSSCSNLSLVELVRIPA